MCRIAKSYILKKNLLSRNDITMKYIINVLKTVIIMITTIVMIK